VSFTEFVAAQQRGLLRFAMVLTCDAHLAEDIVQDVITRTFVRWQLIGTMDHPAAYVRRMIVNDFLSWRRRWSRTKPFAVLPDDAAYQPDHAAMHAERSALAAELAKLPRRQRTVLVLRFYLGMSDSEIAAALVARQARCAATPPGHYVPCASS
jgi:RNA polymerase sigma factor (sigma-70 family)